MASSDHLTRLVNIRDSQEKIIADELARVQALVAAGNPPPTTYSAGGRNFAWNEWYKGAIENLKKRHLIKGDGRKAIVRALNSIINDEKTSVPSIEEAILMN